MKIMGHGDGGVTGRLSNGMGMERVVPVTDGDLSENHVAHTNDGYCWFRKAISARCSISAL